jgi:hypothetical protein
MTSTASSEFPQILDQITNTIFLQGDLKKLEFHLFDKGHFALEEDGDVIAGYMGQFLTTHVLSVAEAR